MKKEKKSILEFLKSLFRKESGDMDSLPAAPTEDTVERLVDRTLGEKPPRDESGSSGDDAPHESSGDDNPEEGKKESCPYATKRAIVESIAEIRKFAEEHELAASVLRSLLALLGEIALGTLKGKVSRQILELLLKAINYELAVEEAFRKGHEDGRLKGHEAGRKEWLEERYPSQDDGLPHINGAYIPNDNTTIFAVAAEANKP